MANPRLLRLLEQVRASRFTDLQGTRISASFSIGEPLLNAAVAAAAPPSLPVRDVEVHPVAGGRIRVRAKLTRADFLPPISLTLEIERQPQAPNGPLVLRIASLPGLVSLASATLPVASMLPPGITLEDQRLIVDVWHLLDKNGYGDLIPYLDSVRVTTEEGRLLLELNVRI
jgi:hypothetical protein